MNLELITSSGVDLFFGSNDTKDSNKSIAPSISSKRLRALAILSSLPLDSENRSTSRRNTAMSGQPFAFGGRSVASMARHTFPCFLEENRLCGTPKRTRKRYNVL